MIFNFEKPVKSRSVNMPRDPLEAVYRLIGLFRYQEAIHLLNKILKKQPNFLVAKVWKCEALYGMGNIVECEELMSEILEQAFNDKPAIDCIAEFYRARGNYAKLVEVYESALKVDPNDEKWRKALFECCGLAGDYKKQQQQAFLLYKQSPRMLFYCMAVVCMIQQAKDSPVSLEVAERMMNKKYDDGKLKSRHEIILLICVLEKRGKIAEALELLEKPDGDLDSLISTGEKRIELLIQLERWQDIIIEAKKVLNDNPDNWLYWKQYLMAVVELEASGKPSDDPDVDNTEEKALAFLTSLQDANPILRGPRLAGIELAKLTSQKGKDVNSVLCDRIVNYFDTFGAKPICMFDLSLYITLVPENLKTDLLNRISVPGYSKLDPTELQNQLTPAKHVSFLQFNKLLGEHAKLTSQQREQYCVDLLKCYQTAGTNQRQEQYLLLMTYERMTLFRETGDAEHLILAVCAIEEGLEQSPAFSLQVLLLQLYFALGASKAARSIYEKLRIQSVQVDTLVHLFLANLSSTGHFTIAAEMWETGLKILQQCTIESLEALVWTYRVGMFHRVEEFTLCARRFQKTITVPLLKNEKSVLDLVMGEPSRAEQILSRVRSKIDWATCMDNRDLKAVPSWEPPVDETHREQSFSELLLFCKIREATLFCLITGIAYAKQREESEEKAFRQSIDELQQLNADAASRSLDPHTSRLHHIVQAPIHSILEKIFEPDLAASEKICTLLKQSSENSVEIIKASREKNPKHSAEAMVTQIELLSFVTSACGVVKATLATVPKRRCEQIVRTLITSWNGLESSLSTTNDTQPSSGNTRDTVEARLKENSKAATDDLRKVIRKKLGYLQKLNQA